MLMYADRPYAWSYKYTRVCGQVPFFPMTHLPTAVAVMLHSCQRIGVSGVSTRILFGNSPKRHKIPCWSSTSPKPAIVYMPRALKEMECPSCHRVLGIEAVRRHTRDWMGFCKVSQSAGQRAAKIRQFLHPELPPLRQRGRSRSPAPSRSNSPPPDSLRSNNHDVQMSSPIPPPPVSETQHDRHRRNRRWHPDDEFDTHGAGPSRREEDEDPHADIRRLARAELRRFAAERDDNEPLLSTLANTVPWLKGLTDEQILDYELEHEIAESGGRSLDAADKSSARALNFKLETEMTEGAFDKLAWAFPELAHLESYFKTCGRIAKLSGVKPVRIDRCVNSCMAYTGVRRPLTRCPHCGEKRYEPDPRHPNPVEANNNTRASESVLISGIKSVTPLARLSSIELPTSFPHDFMHAMLENVIPTLTSLWTRTGRFSSYGTGREKYLLGEELFNCIGDICVANVFVFPRSEDRLPEAVRNCIGKYLEAVLEVPWQEVSNRLSRKTVVRWGKMQEVPESGPGDTFRGYSMCNDNRKSKRNASYVKYQTYVDRSKRPNQKVDEPVIGYGRVEYFLVLDADFIQSLYPDETPPPALFLHPHALALVSPIPHFYTVGHNFIRYKLNNGKLQRPEVVDASAILKLVGRVHDRGLWHIVDRTTIVGELDMMESVADRS
ncbi:unnamed protein product [Rhizoctonia solani]|uniref:Transposase family Tnp2 protein n=1 Tax=Rhizoctonia solani TaxID=456999 RepID=A0A8H3CMQ3_9AGAM|nr:unnamed protein product [Rhizoctonia solani]